MNRCAMCDEEFDGDERRIYCSESCRVQASKRSMAENRRRNRIKRRRQSRKQCVICGTILSMYGEGNTCDAHTDPRLLKEALKNIKGRV